MNNLKNIYKLINLLFVLVLVGGCGKKIGICSSELPKNKNLVTMANQNDLAVPVGYRLKGYSQSSNASTESLLFVYDGNQGAARVGYFYKKELELRGWIYSDLSTKKEGLLIANKSQKKCAISIRPVKENSSSVYLFIQNSINSDRQNFVDLNRINEAR